MHDGEVMYFWNICFKNEFAFLRINSMNSLSLFLNLFMLICNMIRLPSFLLLGMCPCVVSVVMRSCGRTWSVYEVVWIPYVDTLVSVTVMRILLFVLHVCTPRKCKGVRGTAMLVWEVEEVWLYMFDSGRRRT